MSAILVTLPYKLKKDIERESLELYVADTLYLVLKDVAALAGGFIGSDYGQYMTQRFGEIFGGASKKKQLDAGETRQRILTKLRD